MANRVTVELALQDRGLRQGIREAAQAARELDSDLDDAGSAGDAAARLIEQRAEDMRSEIEATRRAVDALDLAYDGVDFDATQAVAELKRLGLNAGEIEADAEQLAAALRAIDEVDVTAVEQGFDNVGSAIQRSEGDTRRADDTMRGFVGNAVAELPLVGDAFGPAGEAVSQLTEGLLEGDIGAGDLIRTLGGMAAVGGAVMLVAQAVGEIQESRAFDRDQVDGFTEAALGADEALDGIVQSLIDAQEIVVRGGGLFGLGEEELDIVPLLAEVGFTIDDVRAAVEASDFGPMIADLEAYRQGLVEVDEQHGLSTFASDEAKTAYDELGTTIDGLPRLLTNMTLGVEQAELESKFWASTLDDELTPAVDDSREAIEEHVQALQDEAEELERGVELLEEQYDARMSMVEAAYAARDAEDEFVEALVDAGEELAELEPDSREYEAVLRDIAREAGDVAEATLRVEQEQAKAEGRTLTTRQEFDLWTESMLASAEAADGELRQSIIDYIAEVAGIPDAKVTELSAAVEQGDLDAAMSLLAEASATREVALRAEADTAEAVRLLDQAARTRTVDYVPRVGPGVDVGGNRRAYAGGTKGAHPGVAVVGEYGPELVRFRGGEQVASEGALSSMLGGLGGGSTTIINVPEGTTAADVARMLRRDRLRQGLSRAGDENRWL